LESRNVQILVHRVCDFMKDKEIAQFSNELRKWGKPSRFSYHHRLKMVLDHKPGVPPQQIFPRSENVHI